MKRMAAGFFIWLTAAAAFSDTLSKQQPPNLQVAGDAARGKVLSELERCQGCHGEEGDSDTQIIPKLAGQHATYLVKQVRDFKSGARKHEIMSVMAADVADADINDIAAYFASHPKMQGRSEGESPLGEKLFLHGDAARNITPCAACHGVDGKGLSLEGIVYPVVAGQHRKYLRAQLVSWALGERSNNPSNSSNKTLSNSSNSRAQNMNDIAKTLSVNEIEALSLYLSGL